MNDYRIDAKTAKGAAGQMHRAVRAMSKAIGQDPDIETLARTERRNGHNVYVVSWESGPFEWAVIGTGGGDIWAEELGGYPYANNATPTFDMPGNRKWMAEPYYSFDLHFYN